MTPEVFEAVLTALAPYQWGRVCMYLQNEPMMDPRIFERIASVRERLDFKCIDFSTNLARLGASALERLIVETQGLIVYLGLSFQATDKATFEQRTGLSWETCYENMKRCLQATDSLGWNITIRSCYGGKRAWDWIFKTLWSWGVQGTTGKLAIHTDNGMSRAGNVKGEFAKYHRYPDKNFLACPRLFDWVHVTSDGSLIPCCMDYGREVVFGNLAEEPLLDIQKRILPTMLTAAEGNPDFLCRRCEWTP